MSIELKQAAQQALEALEEIALAGMSGTGQESEEGMRDWHARQAWKFIGIAARALDPLRTAVQQAEAQQPATTEPAGYLYDFKYDDEIVRDWFTQNIDEIQFRPATCLNIRPLYAHPAPGVPDGYVLAPIVPTPEMEKAFRQAFPDQLHKRRNQWGRAKHTMSAEGAGLKAMLTAAKAQKGGE